DIMLVERHPLGSQAFMPLSDHDWLVVVASASAEKDTPDFSSLKCFLASGTQGVNYHKGTWHHPLLVLQPQDFLIADRAGPEGETGNPNLQEHWEDAPVAVVAV
ncbi:MAG: ureidoglycolate lyase, partial [Alphaproteobacteria bacterium]|nr:ureidoglycolate lyase [Alphaproteobacteria bacterium]